VAGTPGYPRVDHPDSCDRFLRRALAAGGTVLAGGAVAAAPQRLAASQSPAQDAEVFNFALLLEWMQAAFYDEAVAQAALPAELLDFAIAERPPGSQAVDARSHEKRSRSGSTSSDSSERHERRSHDLSRRSRSRSRGPRQRTARSGKRSTGCHGRPGAASSSPSAAASPRRSRSDVPPWRLRPCRGGTSPSSTTHSRSSICRTPSTPRPSGRGRSRDRRRAFLAVGLAVVGVARAVRQPLLVLRARSDGRVS
jgi:hypothetical protein